MSRWNDVVTLLSSPNKYQDSQGAWHEGEQVPKMVFCSPMMLGTMALAQLRSSEVRITGNDTVPDDGMHEMHCILIKAIDYDGETQVLYHGKEMEIIAATSIGEDYKVIIRRRVGND